MANIASTCLFPPPTPGPSYSTEPLGDETYDEFDINDVAEACAAHVQYLIPADATFPEPSRASKGKAAEGQVPPLRDFISYALKRTRLPAAVAFSAVALVRRFKRYYPDAAAAPDSRHRLFLAAYILSSKLLQDNPFEQKAWRIVCGGAFSAADIRKMERELCRFLGWNLNVPRSEIDDLVLDELSPWLFAPSPVASPRAAGASSDSSSWDHTPASSEEGHGYSSPSSISSRSSCSTANTSPTFSASCEWPSTSPPSSSRDSHYSPKRRPTSSASASSGHPRRPSYHYLPPSRSASETAIARTHAQERYRR